MAAPQHPGISFPEVDLAALDRCVESFQNALNRGQRPALDSFLPVGHASTDIFWELVHVELEFRIKRGEAARIEEYLRRYPSLAHNAAGVIELLRAEYRLRCRQEPRLSWERFAE